MTKRDLVLVVALMVSQWAAAEDVEFQLKEVTVPAFLELVLHGVLGRDYVMPSDLVAPDKRVSVSVKKISREGALSVARETLAGFGLDLVEHEGVLFVSRTAGAPGAVGPSMAAAVAGDAVLPGARVPGQVAGMDTALPPDYELESYWPRARSSEFLGGLVRLAGGRLYDQKGGEGALTYAGTKTTLGRVKKLLAEVDREPYAVSVRAAVLEYTESSDTSRSFIGALSALGGRLGVTIQAGAKLANAVTWSGATLQAALSAVEGDSRFRYLAQPSLRVLDGQKARLTVGQDVPIRGAVTTDNRGNQMQSIEYRTAGVVLELTPHIYEDSIVLSVKQQISSVTTTTSSGIDSPTVLKREAETVVDAHDRDLIIIAGMDESRDIDSRSGLSILPSWLGGQARTHSRSQILLLLEVTRSKRA